MIMKLRSKRLFVHGDIHVKGYIEEDIRYRMACWFTGKTGHDLHCSVDYLSQYDEILCTGEIIMYLK